MQELRLDAVGKLADLSAELGRILRELRGRVCQHLPLSFVEEKTLVPLVLAVDQVSEAGEMLGDGGSVADAQGEGQGIVNREAGL